MVLLGVDSHPLGGGQDTGSPPSREWLRGEVTNESCILSDSVSLCYPCPIGPQAPALQSWEPTDSFTRLTTSITVLGTHACVHFANGKTLHISPVSHRTSPIRIPYSQMHS